MFGTKHFVVTTNRNDVMVAVLPRKYSALISFILTVLAILIWWHATRYLVAASVNQLQEMSPARRGVNATDVETLFSNALCVVGVTVAMLAVAILVAASLLRKETLHLENNTLTLERTISLWHFHRSRTLRFDQVENIHLGFVGRGPRPALSFESASKTYHFGVGLRQCDIAELVSTVTNALQSQK